MIKEAVNGAEAGVLLLLHSKTFTGADGSFKDTTCSMHAWVSVRQTSNISSLHRGVAKHENAICHLMIMQMPSR